VTPSPSLPPAYAAGARRFARLRLLWSSFREKPGYVGMRALARFGWVRQLVGAMHRVAFCRALPHTQRSLAEALHASRVDIRPDQNIDEFVRRLRDEGISLGLSLRPEDVQAIHTFTLDHPCFADRHPSRGFYNVEHELACRSLDKQILVAQYFNTGTESDTINSLINDPLLRLIACRYLGSEPRFVGANLWWTYPVNASEADRAEHAHLFHRDVDDFRFVKFFFYLTDVLPGDGSHVCVKGSHRKPPVSKLFDRWLIRRYSDEEISRLYPPPDILEITGAAGTGFAENTLCVHKGLTPNQSPRLLLQLQFALFDYGAMHDRRPPGSLKQIHD